MLILYATTTGNALDAAEQIYREAAARGIDVEIKSADEYSPASLRTRMFRRALM
jgi:flavodoxin